MSAAARTAAMRAITLSDGVIRHGAPLDSDRDFEPCRASVQPVLAEWVDQVNAASESGAT